MAKGQYRHPLSQQCPCKSKRSGKQCKRLVVGGGPCAMHGGKAPRVNARREQRILLYEAEQKAAPPPEPELPEPTADETLVAVLRDVRTTLQHLRVEMAVNASPTLLALLGDWLDRADRISRSVIITRAEERIAQRKVAVTQEQVDTLATAMHVGVTASDLSARQRLEVMEAVLEAIGRARAGGLPLVSGEEIQRWLARTRAEAAVEPLPELEAV
jgi:hypothetical protein